MTEVKKISTWVPVTASALADAAPLGAWIEYGLLSRPGPLTIRERLTGWRHFTARSGYVLNLRVGWRASLYWLTHPIENWRRHHPPVFDEEDDD